MAADSVRTRSPATSVGTTPTGLSARYAGIGLRLFALDPDQLVLDAELRERCMRRHRGAPWTPVQLEVLHGASP